VRTGEVNHPADATTAEAAPAVASPRPTGRRWRIGFAGWAVLPFGVFMALFAVYPMVELIRMAFSKVRFERGQFLWSGAGLANFVQILDDAVAWKSVVNTVVFIGTTVPLTILLGTLLAILVDRAVLLHGVARNVVLWPAVITPVVISVMWLLILSPNVGVLNKVLASVGLPGQGLLGHGAGAMFSIILVDVWHWTPVVFLLVYTALRALDADILQAARVDGANEWQVLWRIVLPLLRPALAVAVVIRLIMGVKAFDEMYLLTRGGPENSTTLISLHIRNVFFDRLDLGYGAAFSLIVVLVVALVLALAIQLRRLPRREVTS
jgi:multiple sugar transport system permease protein